MADVAHRKKFLARDDLKERERRQSPYDELLLESKHWPAHFLPDGNMHAYESRVKELADFLTGRGMHPVHVRRILRTGDLVTKEGVAMWLRLYLRKLRDHERIVGTSPVFVGGAVPRSAIADLALTMLECFHPKIGDQLISLFQELLDVDRHRRRRAQLDRLDRMFRAAAKIDALYELTGEPPLSVRFVARTFGVSPSTSLKRLRLWSTRR